MRAEFYPGATPGPGIPIPSSAVVRTGPSFPKEQTTKLHPHDSRESPRPRAHPAACRHRSPPSTSGCDTPGSEAKGHGNASPIESGLQGRVGASDREWAMCIAGLRSAGTYAAMDRGRQPGRACLWAPSEGRCSPFPVQVGPCCIGPEMAADRSIRVDVWDDVDGCQLGQPPRDRVRRVQQPLHHPLDKPLGHGLPCGAPARTQGRSTASNHSTGSMPGAGQLTWVLPGHHPDLLLLAAALLLTAARCARVAEELEEVDVPAIQRLADYVVRDAPVPGRPAAAAEQSGSKRETQEEVEPRIHASLARRGLLHP